MGKNQGVTRLRAGFSRCLTRHEIDRGYVFISLDKHLYEALDVNNFDVTINGDTYHNRRISVSGRFHVPSRILAALGTKRTIQFELVSIKLITLTVA